jgi:hypothetical protein
LGLKGTVQRELRWVKIGINRTARKHCIAGKCHLPRPKGHHHKQTIIFFFLRVHYGIRVLNKIAAYILSNF